MNAAPYILSLVFYVAVAAGIRKIVGHFDISFIVNIRYVFHFGVAAVLAAAIGWKTRGHWRALLTPKDCKVQAVRSVAAFGGTVSFLFTGFFLPISLSNCLALAFRPIIILALGLIPRFRERTHGKKWIVAALVTALGGVTMMFFAYRQGGSSFEHLELSNLIWGPLVILVNEMFTAFGYHLNRAAARSGESKWTTLAFSALFGALVSTAMLLSGLSIPVPYGVPGTTAAGSSAWVWLSVVVTLSICAQLLQQVAAGKLPTSTLSFLAVLQPVIGGIFDFAYFGVVPNGMMLAAMATLIASAVLGMPSQIQTQRSLKEQSRISRTRPDQF